MFMYKFVEDKVRSENPYERSETIRPKAIKSFSPNTFFSDTSKFPTKLLNMYFFYNSNSY